MSASNSKSASGFVQGLHNHYQKTRKTQNEVTYAVTGPAPGDKYTATVTLKNTGQTFTGTAVGVQPAKEAAARKAMQALGFQV